MGFDRAQRALAVVLFVALTVAGVVTFVSRASAGAAAGPALVVNGGAGRHPISPYIYGLNFAEPGLAAELSLPIDRWGGNTTDTYNFHIGADNTGAAYFYENIADCWSEAHNWCSGQSTNANFAYREFVSQDEHEGSQTLFTLPLVGYVANDAPVAHPLTCGFPASVFPSQEAFDPYDSGCGNGIEGGKPVASEPGRDGTPTDAAYDGAFVRDMVSRFGTATHGGVGVYELGNEPGLWDSTHRDVHPSPTTYDELWQKSHEAALAVKEADPSAAVLGFSEWGWPNYFCSAADGAPQSACTASDPDRAAHGGTPLVEWLLQQFHGSEESTGKRLLDYIDIHYYAQGGSDTEVTRSLWDPTYTDPSWIAAKIDLLPRMHEWVARNYPGTKTALSEYNLSVSSNPVVNALIQADTLGIFAREGLDLATRWGQGNDGPLIYDAFRMFRDYDGAHGQFGDEWVSSTSADQSRLAVYGAERTGDGSYTILVINKTGEALTSPLSLSGVTPAGPAQVWQWTGGAITRQADQPVSASGFSATYPAQSLTLFVVPCAKTSPTGPATSAGAPGGTPVASGTSKAPPSAAAAKHGAKARRCCVRGHRRHGKCVRGKRRRKRGGHARRVGSCRRPGSLGHKHGPAKGGRTPVRLA